MFVYKMNQNRNNLLIVDFPSILNINYVRYAIQCQEKLIKSYFFGSCQTFIRISDLNNLFEDFSIKFRSVSKDEDLTGKLLFNRVGKFGIDIHE